MLKRTHVSGTRPEGWLRDQLTVQNNGACGNMHKTYPVIYRSAWIGGDSDNWEKLPYWLDGFIPMVWLLGNEEKKQLVRGYMDTIVERQQDDGWFAPCRFEDRKRYDLWAYFLMGKVFAGFCEITQEKKYEESLYRAMKCLHECFLNGTVTMSGWGENRWEDCLIPLIYLYDRYPEQWIIDLAGILKDRGADFASMSELWKKPINKWTMETHIVNAVMCVKYEEVYCRLTGEKPTGMADYLTGILEKHNGNAVGAFNGDECVAGPRNHQGFELCSVVEAMYAYETLYEITGDTKWAERTEKLAFNALPAATTDDMWNVQYDQQVNQIDIIEFKWKNHYRANNNTINTFGFFNNFHCCLTNHGQGWSKFAASVFHITDRGLEATHILPETVEEKVSGVNVRISCETGYPFRKTAKFSVKADAPVTFEFRIRVPKFVRSFRVNGMDFAGLDFCRITKEWSDDTLEVVMDYDAEYTERQFGLHCVTYGNLVFSMPIRGESVHHDAGLADPDTGFRYRYYELRRQEEWRYGFSGSELTVDEKEISSTPFSSENCPVTVRTKLAGAEWSYKEGYDTVPEFMPDSHRKTSEETDRKLVPYGCTKLRMTEMPILDR